MVPQAFSSQYVTVLQASLSVPLTSALVQDFTEVDNNVTRNIAGELENNDWGLMVLHYLGLDHIGHKSGPRR
jgi:hypothetical protein